MLDHVSIGVNDVTAAGEVYDAALKPLGMARVFEMDGVAIGYGVEHPILWVQSAHNGEVATAGNGTHICFQAPTRKAVDDFFAAAIAKGATDDGAPGLRPEYSPTYYGAFILDMTGNKIEAVCHKAE